MSKKKSKPATHQWHHRALRPATFLSILLTGLAAILGFGFLVMILLVKPYQQQQDIRQQAREIQGCIEVVDLPRIECEALVTLYESTNGAGWTTNPTEIPWFSSPYACEWYGINCGNDPRLERPDPTDKHVVSIILSRRQLKGPLPIIWDSFAFLQQLDLSGNGLTGSLTNLRLLQSSSLISINLSNNKLSGNIPDVFNQSQVLTSLDLSSNNLTGPVPPSLGKLASLRQLSLHDTLLSGSLPDSLGQTQLQLFFTARTSLCLPTTLNEWYQSINQVDGLTVCNQFTTNPLTNSCNSICREDSECPANLFCNLEDARTGHCRLLSNPNDTQCLPATKVTATPTPAPTATPTPGTSTSGDTASCNQDCQSNADCGINLRCYDLGDTQRCRLATNPASESCANVTDQGLSFACNEYCSDTSECAGDLTCWYNRCRDPENVSSASCTPASGELRDLMQNNCNERCSSNRDCVINMRCYGGACRLATNPTSQSCSAAPAMQSGKTGTQTKGGLNGSDATNGGQLTPTTPVASTSATPTIVQPTTSPVEPTTAPPAGPSVLDQIKDWFSGKNLLESRGLLIGLVVAGVILLLLGIFGGKRKKTGNDNRLATPPTVRSTENQSTGMIDRIKEKGISPPK